MALKSSDRILGPARGTAAKWIAIGTSRGVNRLGEFTAFVNEVYRLGPLVGVDPALVVSQSALECSNWTDDWWTNRLNPAGIGITGDAAENAASKTFASGTEAAQAQVTHLWLYTSYGDATPVALRDLIKVDPRASALIASGWAGTAKVLSDLNNKWAANANYGAEIAQRGNELYDGLPDQDATQGGTPTVGQYTTTIPGLPGGPLVTDYPIDTATFMLPQSNTYQRPGYPAQTPRRSVAHGTGNPNSLARDDASWVHGGADGIQESMHFECDDAGCFQLVPVNEVTWQAADGSGPGNMNGVSCEMTENGAVWADTARRNRAIHVAADLLGRIAARLNIAVPERHYDFNAADPNRHHCPNQLMNTGLWDAAYVPQWKAAKADELARMNGGSVTPTTQPPTTPPPIQIVLPTGMDNDLAARWFGSVTAKGLDGKTHTYSYNPNGAVSSLWAQNGKQTGSWPKLVKVEVFDTRAYFEFANGLVIWQPNAQTPVAVLK